MTKDRTPYKFPPRLGEEVQQRYRYLRRKRHPDAAELTWEEQRYVARWLDYDPDLWYNAPGLIKEGLLEIMAEWVAAEGDEKKLAALRRYQFGHRGM